MVNPAAAATRIDRHPNLLSPPPYPTHCMRARESTPDAHNRRFRLRGPSWWRVLTSRDRAQAPKRPRLHRSHRSSSHLARFALSSLSHESRPSAALQRDAARTPVTRLKSCLRWASLPWLPTGTARTGRSRLVVSLSAPCDQHPHRLLSETPHTPNGLPYAAVGPHQHPSHASSFLTPIAFRYASPGMLGNAPLSYGVTTAAKPPHNARKRARLSVCLFHIEESASSTRLSVPLAPLVPPVTTTR
jgi:hypothetical protein